MPATAHPDAITSLVNGDHGAPFDLLGPQPLSARKTVIRAFRPSAQSLYVVSDRTKKRAAMQADPNWAIYLKNMREAGILLAQENEILVAAPWSPDPRK